MVAILVVAAVAGVVWFRGWSPSGRTPSVSPETTPTPDGVIPAEGTPRLKNPLGAAFVDGRLYVAESDAGVLRVFDRAGKAVASLPVPPAGRARVSYPADVTALGSGKLAVLDTASQRVVVMGARDGRVQGIVGSGETTLPLGQPTALAADGGLLYVADADDHTIKVYGPDGSLQRVLGEDLRPSLTFVGGMGVGGGRLWLSDSNAGRVLSLDPASGAQTSVLPAPFSLPRGVALGPARTVLVADAFKRTTTSFDADGSALFVLEGPPEEGAAGVRSPRGIAYSSADARVYVTDAAAGVVRVYRFTSRR